MTHVFGGFSTGALYASLYGYFAFAFFTGSYLVTGKVYNDNSEKIYTSGDILSIFFGIVYGVFSLGLAAPNLKAITEGRVAGKMAYDVIERRPKIPLN
jgi:hypothetical protein